MSYHVRCLVTQAKRMLKLTLECGHVVEVVGTKLPSDAVCWRCSGDARRERRAEKERLRKKLFNIGESVEVIVDAIRGKPVANLWEPAEFRERLTSGPRRGWFVVHSEALGQAFVPARRIRGVAR